MSKMPFVYRDLNSDDGIRIIEMVPRDQAPRATLFDRLRLRIENWLQYPVDWTPLPPVVEECKSSETMIRWKVRYDICPQVNR